LRVEFTSSRNKNAYATRLSTICEIWLIPTGNRLAITPGTKSAIIIQFIKSTRDSTLRSRKKNHAVSRFYDSRCAINFKNATSFAHSRAILNVTLHKYATIHCDSAVALGKRGTISISLNLIFSKLALSDGLIEKRFIIYYSSICWDGRKNKDCTGSDPSDNAKSAVISTSVLQNPPSYLGTCYLAHSQPLAAPVSLASCLKKAQVMPIFLQETRCVHCSSYPKLFPDWP